MEESGSSSRAESAQPAEEKKVSYFCSSSIFFQSQMPFDNVVYLFLLRLKAIIVNACMLIIVILILTVKQLVLLY